MTNPQPDLAMISADFEGAAKESLQIEGTFKRRNPDDKIVVMLETSTRESVIGGFDSQRGKEQQISNQ